MVSWGHEGWGQGFMVCFSAVPELPAGAELLGMHTCS